MTSPSNDKPKRLTAKEQDLAVALHPKHTAREVAEHLGCAIHVIEDLWKRRKLRRTGPPLRRITPINLAVSDLKTVKVHAQIWQDQRSEAGYSKHPTESYQPTELQPSQRPGANDFAQWPSRIGRWRVYLDGRKEAV